MDSIQHSKTKEWIEQKKDVLINQWIEEIKYQKIIKKSILSEYETENFCAKLMEVFIRLLDELKDFNLHSSAYADVKKSLEIYSRSTASKGFSPTETSMFIHSLKGVLFTFLQKTYSESTEVLNIEIIRVSNVLDKMGLFTFELFVKERESIIIKQQQDMIELSTPVIRVWDGILAVPLIGTLDSKRTQMIMEKLLEMIVTTGSKVAIMDITGVPAVDTLVANHLLKTASATKLLGAELIITGISPVVAQTMVHLGVDLSRVITRALMADGIQFALEMTDTRVMKINKNS